MLCGHDENYTGVYEAKKDVAREAVLQNAHYVKEPVGLPKDINAITVSFLYRQVYAIRGLRLVLRRRRRIRRLMEYCARAVAAKPARTGMSTL